MIRTLDQLFLGNNLVQWAWAIATSVGVLLLTVAIRRIVNGYLKRASSADRAELLALPLQIASRTSTLFLLILSVFLGMEALTLPALTSRIAEKVLLIATCWQVGIWASAGALTWLEHKRRFKLSQDHVTAGTLSFITAIVRGAIWAVVVLVTLDNLGVNITTLVAGLGIGGIAIALSVQNILGDLLASLSITLDKPFVAGDSLTIDDINGTVEQIGLKSTRLRSVNGEQIIMPNADLLKSRVRNFGRMSERRSVFTLSVVYGTAREKLQHIPDAVRALVTAQNQVRFDRCHLARFSLAAIEFEVVYFMLTADYKTYMDTQQRINLEILAFFEREGIQFAQNAMRVLLADAHAASTVVNK